MFSKHCPSPFGVIFQEGFQYLPAEHTLLGRAFMNSDKIIQSLLGLLILILSGLFTWSLVRINDLNDKDAELKIQIALMQQTLNGIASNTDADAKQDNQLKKHWTIVSRHRDWINELRAGEGLPFHSWPDLSGF